jgi:hypothetical protein
MKKFRLALLAPALATFLAVALAACGQSENADTVQSAGEDAGQAVNQLLAYVPADTPYVAANLEPVPEDVIDRFLERLQPALDEAQSQLSRVLADLEAGQSANPDDGNGEADRFLRLQLAILRELDGKLSRPGIESLGLDIRSLKVLYGMGAFPVFRTGLSDPAALRATVLRVLDNAGIQAPEQELRGKPYWLISDEDDGDVPMGLYVSIQEDHLAISVFPTGAQTGLLTSFLGIEKPAKSDAGERLARLNQAQGYTPYGSAYLDLHRMADQFFDPESPLARLMAEEGGHDSSSFPQECVSEIHGIIDNAPLMTAGTTELTPSVIAYQYRIETPDSLAKELMELVAEIPVANALSKRILEFSFGMRFGPVRDFLREKAAAIVDNPYRCEHLLELNDQANEALVKLNQPMPPFLNNFRGVRVSLDEVMMNSDSIPENARGHLAVHVEQPEMFVGMAQMFLPDLSEIALTPGDPPVRLPESLVPVAGMAAYAAMSSEAIGLAVGEGEQDSLPEFLDRDAGPKGTFLTANYDMATYLEYTDQLGDHMGQNYAEDAAYGSMEHDAVHSIAEAGQQAMRDMMDRSYTTMRFSEDGFVVDGKVTFK